MLSHFQCSNDTTRFQHVLGWIETKSIALTYFVAILGLVMLFPRFLNFLVGYELQTYTYALLGHFKHFLVLFETKFLTLAHLVDMLGLEVLFSHFLKFW